MTNEDIKKMRAEQPNMRDRDFARIHKISEGQLLAAYIGETAKRLNVDFDIFLNGAKTLGEVMVLTRNEAAVHEKIGVFEKVILGGFAHMTLGTNIDLRIFPKHWTFGFAVEKTADDGSVKRSFQFFNQAGDAVFKIHARPATDIEAWNVLVGQLEASDQNTAIEFIPAEAPAPLGEPASVEELRASWRNLTDTHEFFGMLRKLNLHRLQALRMVGEEFTQELDVAGIHDLYNRAAEQQLPIMVFVASPGCVQIHTGEVSTIKPMGPWLNVMDETFHMHLRTDMIDTMWAVKKPVDTGFVYSVEAYDAAGEMIVQFFGKRKEGQDELNEWRDLVAGLAHKQEVAMQ